MDNKKLLGIIFLILGLIFVIYPIYSAEVVSIILGLCLISFGFAELINGFYTWDLLTSIAAIKIIVGIIAILFGILFIYSIEGLAFIIGYQFYIIAFIMIFVGILGLVSESTMSKLASIVILIIGIIAVILAVFSVAQPLYAAVLLGIGLIIDGVCLLID